MMTDEQRIERIERYLGQELSETETAAFEAEMERDPDLRRDVTLHRKANAAIRYARQREMKERLQEIDKELNPGRRRRFLQQFAIAASVLVVVAFGAYIINRTDLVADRGTTMTAEELAVEFFAPATVNQMRGSESDTNTYSIRLADADELFSKGEYARAAGAYATLSRESHPQSEKAEWNMMLARLADGDSTYQPVLESIARDNTHMFHEKSKKLANLLGELH